MKSLTLKSVLAALGMAGITTMAQADAGQTVSRLLNTKLSLFTYGMAELGERMGRIADELMATGTDPGAFLAGGARYDKDAKRISLSIRQMSGAAAPDAAAECRRMVQKIRKRGGIDPRTGLLMDGLAHSTYATPFLSEGFPLKHVGLEDARALDGMMFIEVHIQEAGRASPLVCRAPLIGNDDSIEGPG